MARHAGMAVEDIFDGRTISTPEGECFEITTPTGIQVPCPDPDQVKRRILEDLTLVRGIGPVTAGMLRRKGHRTIEDLVSHRRFRDGAKDCVSTVLDGKPDEIVSFIEQRHSPSHPLVNPGIRTVSVLIPVSSSIWKPWDFSQGRSFFSGLRRSRTQRVVVRQFLVRSMEEELPALYLTLQNVREKQVVVSYNGKTFDIPYLVSRSAFYGVEMEKTRHHIDLLHASRRNAGRLLQDCRLSTVEQHLLGISRSHDLPGSMVPEFYETYLQSGNPGPLVPIVEHNRHDVSSLAKLLFLFSEGPA